MTRTQRTKRLFGQILVDGGFLSREHLGAALEEQKRTNELLGQVLVRMGVLDPGDIQAVLSVQGHLGRAEDAAKTAAGVRRMLGELLVQAGSLTETHLEQALAEQKRSGEQLGAVLVRLGYVTERQLEGLLDFQRNQAVPGPVAGPLRLGELLVSTGVISRKQLEDALRKQRGSARKLGEVLVEQGYAHPHQIKRGVRLQQMLVTAALVALLAACGSGAGGARASSVPSATGSTASSAIATAYNGQEQAADDYLLLTTDEYGLLQPTFFYATDNDTFWCIESAVAKDAVDPDYKTIIRIDIPKTNGASLPDVSGKTFSIEADGPFDQFPGFFLVFNGQKSTFKKAVAGTISFSPGSSAAEKVEGDFDIVIADYDSTAVPAPRYRLQGRFSFTMNTSGPVGALTAANAQ